MIYYVAVFIFVMVTLLFYVAIERKNDQETDRRSSDHNLLSDKKRVYDAYIFELNDAIMRADLNSGIYKR